MSSTPSKFRVETFGDNGARLVEVRFQDSQGPPYKIERRGDMGWYKTYTSIRPTAWHGTPGEAWDAMERQQADCVVFHEREHGRALARLDTIQKMRSEHG